MKRLRPLRLSLACAALGFAALTCAPLPARADVSVGLGGFFGNGTSSAGGIASIGVIGVPLTPVTGELSVAVPFASGGGYATTLDGRANLAGTTLGAGIGFGTLGNTATTGTIYDAILAHTIAPHTALEGRVYFGSNRTSTVVAGVRFSL